MPIFKAIGKWVKGWRLDKFFDELFQQSENGDITVGDSAAKVISVIDQIVVLWAQIEPLYAILVSNEAEASADKVKAEMLNVRAMLAQVQTLPDVAEQLNGYRFADDDKRNDFYHSLISTAAWIFNDGAIEPTEAILFLTKIALYVKGEDTEDN